MKVIFLIFVLIHSVVHSERTPQIVRITEDIIRNIGGAVELSCSVLYLQKQNTVLWKKMDSDQRNSFILSSDTTPHIRDSRYSLRYDSTSTTYTLQIKDIQESDSGVYKCQILMSSTNFVSKDVNLMVYSPPLIYDNASSSLVVSEKNPVYLECYASGVPKPLISWKRENNAVLPTGGSIYRGSVLKINSVRKEDRGTYYCTADNRVGIKVKKSFVVEVEFAPIVTSMKREVYQAPHHDAELSCRVEAFPTPEIIWEKDGSQISTNSKSYNIYQAKAFGEYTESILRAINIGSKHYGSYLCKTTNKLGHAEAQIELYQSESPVCPPACGSGHYSGGLIVSPSIEIVFFIGILLRLLSR